MANKMSGNNKAYWDVAMKFFNLEDGDVNRLKKDIDDRDSRLYELVFTWNQLKHTGKIKGLRSFKTNFSKFFGLDIPTDATREDRRFWYKHIDEIDERWNKYIKVTEANIKGDNE